MRQKRMQAGVLGAMLLAAGAAHAGEAKVYFITPTDGAVTGQEIDVRMGADGLIVEPAGELHANAGHFHILIDEGPTPKGQVVPKDARHLHFGKGQHETHLKLTPGKHTLTLQFADGHHVSYGKALSQTIQITVK